MREADDSMVPLRVTFLGPAASFSHQAAVETFGISSELIPCVSFAEAIAAVQNGDADYAIVPFENSTNGSVVQTLDLLVDRSGIYDDLQVYSEYYLTVHHCLLARKGLIPASQRDYRAIVKLYTHPQAWGQCEKFLGKHFRGVERQDVSSTSKAGEIVLNTKTEANAAIASRFAGEHYGLDILEENIEDTANNTTRFLVLGSVKAEHSAQLPFEAPGPSPTQEQPLTVSKSKKTLISFMIRQDTLGTLADALLIFKNFGLNLTSISTRPSQIQAWKYVFLVESESKQKEDVVHDIMDSLKGVTENCRYLEYIGIQVCEPSSFESEIAEKPNAYTAENSELLKRPVCFNDSEGQCLCGP
ncbi:prephenate dehydratase PHA2 [Aspergillus lucknowensis]|uniref:prephenate dehydratase n=1 Tax=Aspergillus lucknowensis TaxID=176173 RepID=A0ABR4LSG6_9EURO